MVTYINKCEFGKCGFCLYYRQKLTTYDGKRIFARNHELVHPRASTHTRVNNNIGEIVDTASSGDMYLLLTSDSLYIGRISLWRFCVYESGCC